MEINKAIAQFMGNLQNEGGNKNDSRGFNHCLGTVLVIGCAQSSQEVNDFVKCQFQNEISLPHPTASERRNITQTILRTERERERDTHTHTHMHIHTHTHQT